MFHREKKCSKAPINVSYEKGAGVSDAQFYNGGVGEI